MNERLSKIINDPKAIPIGVGVVSLGVGVAIGYILGRKSHKQDSQAHEFPDRPVFDADKVERFIEQHEKKVGIVWKEDQGSRELRLAPPRDSPVPDNIVMGREFVEQFVREGDEEIPEQPALDDVLHQSIFAASDDNWNYEEELAKRTENEPYIIHRDEFYGDEKDYTQNTVTYYVGDNVLVDEDDTPIYNHSKIIGPLLFGRGSGDPNVFHVRNDKRHAEYEVLFDPGHYAVEVLGLSDEEVNINQELKHSDGVRRFRPED